MTLPEHKKKWYLFPFAFLYGVAVSIRNRLFDYNIIKSKEFDIPIICIGNISAGGTGKTPHVEYLVKYLSKEFNPVVLSRGYKRKTKGFLKADISSTVDDIGDESKQIKQKFPEIEVVVDEKRVHAVEKLLEDDKNSEINAIILDDAFQHRKIKPGINILLIDYNRPITKDFLLPVGNLRERSWRKKRAHIIIVTKTPADMKPIERRIMEKELNLFPYQSLFFTKIVYGKPRDIFTHKEKDISLVNANVLLITGIAFSNPLVEYLKSYTNDIVHLKYPDHYKYKTKDIDLIQKEYQKLNEENKVIITTEKDAVRLIEMKDFEKFKKIPFFYIPIEVQFFDEEKEKYFQKIIYNYVKNNKRHNKLYI
ncbi:MAG: tetraacyldisaccharide 4'-kinase [Marinilabiliales bacterium]